MKKVQRLWKMVILKDLYVATCDRNFSTDRALILENKS